MKFAELYGNIRKSLSAAPVYNMNSWQSTTTNQKALRMREIHHFSLKYKIPNTVEELAEDVNPFLPWADKHFENERIDGQPINPGETYKEWRYPASAKQHTDFEFSHSYAERYWPQYAGHGNGGKIDWMEVAKKRVQPHKGIRHSYGDLSTLIHVLERDPTTRQAYLPIFFPEDLTAVMKNERVPCTLGYHFLCRNGSLDITYPMRSCDFVRHFRDDVYLTCRLLLWVLEQLREWRPESIWKDTRPGFLIMHITSLHCFEEDEL